MDNAPDRDADPVSWFEPLYAGAARGARDIPWDRGVPHPVLVAWAAREPVTGHDRRAVVVGAGTGDDAVFVAGMGFNTIAFDVSPSAIAIARQRYPEAAVTFTVADLFAAPPGWSGGFDLVVEIQTVQALPQSLRQAAISAVASLVAPGGRLVAIAAAADDHRSEGPPWPLTRDDLDGYQRAGLTSAAIDRIPSTGGSSFGSFWLTEYVRPAPGAQV